MEPFANLFARREQPQAAWYNTGWMGRQGSPDLQRGEHEDTLLFDAKQDLTARSGSWSNAKNIGFTEHTKDDRSLGPRLPPRTALEEEPRTERKCPGQPGPGEQPIQAPYPEAGLGHARGHARISGPLQSRDCRQRVIPYEVMLAYPQQPLIRGNPWSRGSSLVRT